MTRGSVHELLAAAERILEMAKLDAMNMGYLQDDPRGQMVNRLEDLHLQTRSAKDDIWKIKDWP